LVPSSRAK